MRKGKEFYCYKTKDGKEVDFAVKEGLKIGQLMQICYDVVPCLTKKREITALVKAAHEAKCDNLLILTWDYEEKEKSGAKQITYMTLWKWLVSSNTQFDTI